MEQFLYYLLRIAIALTLFYLAYQLFLRNQKQFVFNRIYLIVSLVASLLIPLVTIPLLVETAPTVAFLSSSSATIVDSIPQTVLGSRVNVIVMVILFFYLSGVVFFLARFGVGYYAALRIKRWSKSEIFNGCTVLVSDYNIRAFTFFRDIVVGRSIVKSPFFSMVLNHEMVHVKENHCVDVIFSEIILAFQWFNPIASLYRKAIRNNLEFRADDVVISSANPEDYQMALVTMMTNRVTPPIFTELNSTNLKKRVIMMKSANKTRNLGMAKLAVIPIYALVAFALTTKEYVVAQTLPTTPQHNLLASSIQSNANEASIATIDDLRRFMVRQIRYPQKTAELGHTGIVSLYLQISQQGDVKEIFEQRPAGDVIEIDEVMAVALAGEGINIVEIANQKDLTAECRRVINIFPRMQIPEIAGKLVRIQIVFALQ